MSPDTISPTPADVDVSVVLPVHNEAGHVVDEIDRIRKALDESGYAYEIIVIDDGSTDESGAILREVPGIRFVQMRTNRGSGRARSYGTRLAVGEIVVWTDADMSYPNHDIPSLVKHMEGYDQVVGVRRIEAGTMRILRVPAKWIIRRLASALTQSKIPDLNSGLRAFRRDVALQFLHLLPPGFSCVTTITLAFLSNGYSINYVPIDYHPRAGNSKFHWYRDTKRYLLQVVRMTMIFNPLRAFMPIAVTLTVVGSAKLIYDLVTKDLRVATNTLAVLAGAGVILVLGLIADLIVQVNHKDVHVLPAEVMQSDPPSN